jgi:hypothetical protein
MIDCGSLEVAHARLSARHGERPDAAAWRRIETLREIAPLLEAARATGLRPWLVGIGAQSNAHQVEAILRGHWRALVDEVAAWMPAPWQAPIAWCAVLPDLALLQHLARGGEPQAWMQDDSTWRELVETPPQARAAVLSAGPFAALAVAWPTPQAIGLAWRNEFQRRLPRAPSDSGGPGDAGTLAPWMRLLLDHSRAFADASGGQGWSQRSALRAQLSMLLRRAVLEPAAAFIHITLCALDLERLRAELLRRFLFRRGVHPRAA